MSPPGARSGSIPWKRCATSSRGFITLVGRELVNEYGLSSGNDRAGFGVWKKRKNSRQLMLARQLQPRSCMRTLARTLTISALLWGFAPAAHAQVTFDLRIGHPPPAPRLYRVPVQPGPAYVWVEGYWYPRGRHYAWHNGYWTLPPYTDAYWVAPYYSGGRYFAGRWEGRRGRLFHDHRWDRTPRRDHRDWRDRDRHRRDR
jgi:hypothetical protein